MFRTCVTLAAMTAALCRADDPPTSDDATRAETLAAFKRQAAGYTVTPTGGRPLALHPDPLVRFSNPVGGVTDGVVMAWKDGERPAVFAQLFRLKDGLWIHEVQSAAAEGLSMAAGGKPVWTPPPAAADFRPLAGAPVAAGTLAARLVQMKAQAARFAADEDFRARVSDPDTSRYRLRLLPTPVLRYRDPKQGIDDGAVFALVHGTDPELFLLLETRGGDRPGWYYALVPMTCWAVTAKLDDKQVWTVAERQGKSTRNGPYHVWVHRPAD